MSLLMIAFLLLNFFVGVPVGAWLYRWWIRREGYVPHIREIGSEVRVGPWKTPMLLTEYSAELNQPTTARLTSTDAYLEKMTVEPPPLDPERKPRFNFPLGA